MEDIGSAVDIHSYKVQEYEEVMYTVRTSYYPVCCDNISIITRLLRQHFKNSLAAVLLVYWKCWGWSLVCAMPQLFLHAL